MAEFKESEVEDAIISGQFQFDPEERVPVFNPEGKLGSLPGSELALGLSSGYRYATTEKVNEHKLRQRVRDEDISSALVAGARTLTFGSSDYYLTKTGLYSKPELRYMKEENPYATLAGDVLGSVLPFFAPGGQITGGSSLLSKVVMGKTTQTLARYSAPEISEAIGKKVAQTAIKKFVKTGKAPILEGATRGAVEGALYGGGQAVSSMILEEPTKASEYIMAGAGFGGVSGGVIGFAGKLIKARSEKLAKKDKEDVPVFEGILIEEPPKMKTEFTPGLVPIDDETRFFMEERKSLPPKPSVFDNTGIPQEIRTKMQEALDREMGKASKVRPSLAPGGLIEPDESIKYGTYATPDMPADTTAGSPISSSAIPPDTSFVTTPWGAVKTKFKIVEGDSLITSHFYGGLKNIAYPQELQPRNRSRTALLQQVEEIANNPDPLKLINNPLPDYGAPIIGNDLFVESGNGRVIGLKQAYKIGKGEGYRQAIINKGQEIGVPEQTILQMKNPILVRVRETEVPRDKFAQYANEEKKAEMGVFDKARQDASRLEDPMLSVLEMDSKGNFKETEDFLNPLFIKIFPQTQHDTLLTKGGTLSGLGRKRVKDMLFMKAYDEDEVLESFLESPDETLTTIGKSLYKTAGDWAKFRAQIARGVTKDLDPTTHLLNAVEVLAAGKVKGESISDTLARYNLQPELFRDFDISPITKNFVNLLGHYKKDPGSLIGALKKYIQEVEQLGTPGQTGFFQEAEQTMEGVVSKLFDEISEKEMEEAANIIGRIQRKDLVKEAKSTALAQAIKEKAASKKEADEARALFNKAKNDKLSSKEYLKETKANDVAARKALKEAEAKEQREKLYERERGEGMSRAYPLMKVGEETKVVAGDIIPFYEMPYKRVERPYKRVEREDYKPKDKSLRTMFDRESAHQAIRATGAIHSQLKKYFGSKGKIDADRIEEAGKILLELKIVRSGVENTRILEEVTRYREKFGKEIEDMVDEVTAKVQFHTDLEKLGLQANPSQIAGRIRKEVIDPLRKIPVYKETVSRLEEQADRFEALGDSNPTGLTFAQIEDLKRGYYQFVYRDHSALSKDAYLTKMQQFATIVKEESEASLDRIVASVEMPKSTLEHFRDIKKKYGALSAIEDVTADIVARDDYSRRMLTLTDHLAGGFAGTMVGGAVGGAAGGPAGVASGVAFAIGNKILRDYGNATLAEILYKISKLDRVFSTIEGTQKAVRISAKQFVRGVASQPSKRAVIQEGISSNREEQIKDYKRTKKLLEDGKLNRNLGLKTTLPDAVQDALTKFLVQSNDFLYNKLPRNPLEGYSQYMPQEDYAPSVTELQKYQTYQTTVNNPLGAIGHLQKGTINTEEIETLKAIYPSIYKDLITSLEIETVEAKGIPYQKRLQLSRLFGIGIDPSLSNLGMLQGQKEPFEPQKGVGKSGRKLSTQIVKNAETSTQAILS